MLSHKPSAVFDPTWALRRSCGTWSSRGTATKCSWRSNDKTQGDESDVRVVLVKWKGSLRQRGFAEALDLMETVDLSDSELEGEYTVPWHLERIVATGMGRRRTPPPMSLRFRHHGRRSRHLRAPRSDEGFPCGRRKKHLNVFCLESFEILARRAQVIGSVHAFNPCGPVYGHAEDFIGWGCNAEALWWRAKQPLEEAKEVRRGYVFASPRPQAPQRKGEKLRRATAKGGRHGRASGCSRPPAPPTHFRARAAGSSRAQPRRLEVKRRVALSERTRPSTTTSSAASSSATSPRRRNLAP